MKLLKNPRFWLGISFLALLIGLRYSGLGSYITLEMVQQKRLEMMQYVNEHYLLAALAFILVYIMIVVFALPLAALTTVAGGFLFGVIPGAIYTNIGATIGAMIFFLMVRHSVGKTLQEKYKDKLRWFNEQMHKYGVSYLIAIHFIAVIPFFVVNLLIGLTNVPLWTFIWTTSVGIFPGSLVYAFAGQQLTMITSLKDIFSLNILLAFGLLALLALIPIVVQRYKIFGGKE